MDRLKTTALIFALLLSSCVTVVEIQSTDLFEKSVKRWEGQPAQKMVDAIGYPIEERKSPSGNTVYEYKYEYKVISGGNSYTSYNKFLGSATTSVSPSVEEVRSCKIWYELENQVVKKVTWYGNYCYVRVAANACKAYDGQIRSWEHSDCRLNATPLFLADPPKSELAH